MRPFTDILRDIRKGRVIDEATAKMSLAVQGVLDTKKAAVVQLTLTIKPGKGDDGQVTISSQVKVKVPDGDLPEAIFFVDPDEEGLDLLRTDPSQRELFGDAGERSRPAAV